MTPPELYRNGYGWRAVDALTGGEHVGENLPGQGTLGGERKNDVGLLPSKVVSPFPSRSVLKQLYYCETVEEDE